MAGIPAYAEIASHALQREKETELLFRGNAYQAAIASYHRYSISGRIRSSSSSRPRIFSSANPGFEKAHTYSDWKIRA